MMRKGHEHGDTISTIRREHAVNIWTGHYPLVNVADSKWTNNEYEKTENTTENLD